MRNGKIAEAIALASAGLTTLEEREKIWAGIAALYASKLGGPEPAVADLVEVRSGEMSLAQRFDRCELSAPERRLVEWGARHQLRLPAADVRALVTRFDEPLAAAEAARDAARGPEEAARAAWISAERRARVAEGDRDPAKRAAARAEAAAAEEQWKICRDALERAQARVTALALARDGERARLVYLASQKG